jgi:methionyl-tRNA formyltransferase
MIKNLIILSTDQWVPDLKSLYRGLNPGLCTITVSNIKELYAIPRTVLNKSRLISFLSSVIVPSATLSHLKYGAYNFHPAPPARPGWGASSFALFQKDDYFGTTLHRMIEYVDAGPIVGVDTFLIPKGIHIYQLRELVGHSLGRLVGNTAQDIMNNERDLPILPFAWGSMRYSKQDYVDITLIKPDIEKLTLEAMIQAFGEADNVAQLRFVKDGEIYFYAPEKDLKKDNGIIECFIHDHRFVNRFP